MGYILRHRRLQDGSFGELEKVFNGETDEEKLGRLQSENEQLRADIDATLEAVLEIYETVGGEA